MTGKIPQRLQYTVQGHLLHKDVSLYLFNAL